MVKNLPADGGDSGSTPESGRYPGGRNSNPLQYSFLRNPMDRGAWRATVHGIAKSQTQLNMHPGGPVVKNPCFHWKGAQVQSLVGKLRSPHATQHSQKHK